MKKLKGVQVGCGYRGDSSKATQSHFIDCLRSGIEFETGGEEYLKTFQLVFDCTAPQRRDEECA